MKTTTSKKHEKISELSEEKLSSLINATRGMFGMHDPAPDLLDEHLRNKPLAQLRKKKKGEPK